MSRERDDLILVHWGGGIWKVVSFHLQRDAETASVADFMTHRVQVMDIESALIRWVMGSRPDEGIFRWVRPLSVLTPLTAMEVLAVAAEADVPL